MFFINLANPLWSHRKRLESEILHKDSFKGSLKVIFKKIILVEFSPFHDFKKFLMLWPHFGTYDLEILNKDSPSGFL